MIAVVALTGRLLLAHWPALVAWFVAGILGRYLAIQLAGFVGGYSAIGGILLLPLAILSRLVAFVAMFLVLRDGMMRLGVIAPMPSDRRARRLAFRDALLSSILPFFAVYAAWGFLRDDVAAYLDQSLSVKFGRELSAVVAGQQVDTAGTVTELGFEPWTIAVIVIAFTGRWAWKRWAASLPRWTSVGAVYLEAVWVFLVAYLITDAIGSLTSWVQGRQALVWLADAREWVGGIFAPLLWAWDAVGVLIGEVGGVLLLPLAWLTIAGVIYGQAVTPQPVEIRGAVIERVRVRYGSVPQRLRRRLTDIGTGLGSRFQPIWRAIVLMWRGGPILIGGYALLYTVLILGERMLRLGLTRIVGPHDLQEFWMVADTVVLLIVPFVIEPIRVALIASAYDATVGALIGAPLVASGRDDETKEARQLVAQAEVDAERADRVSGDEEPHDDGVGIGPVGRA